MNCLKGLIWSSLKVAVVIIQLAHISPTPISTHHTLKYCIGNQEILNPLVATLGA